MLRHRLPSDSHRQSTRSKLLKSNIYFPEWTRVDWLTQLIRGRSQQCAANVCSRQSELVYLHPFGIALNSKRGTVLAGPLPRCSVYCCSNESLFVYHFTNVHIRLFHLLLSCCCCRFLIRELGGVNSHRTPLFQTIRGSRQ